MLTPLNPKPGVYRCTYYFSYFCSKHRLWVLIRTASANEYPQSMFLSGNVKILEGFFIGTFQFLEVKFSIYWNRRVFVMKDRKIKHPKKEIRKSMQTCCPVDELSDTYHWPK